MKKLNKLKLKEFHQMNETEMKHVIGGQDSWTGLDNSCSGQATWYGNKTQCNAGGCRTSKNGETWIGECRWTGFVGKTDGTCGCMAMRRDKDWDKFNPYSPSYGG